MFIIYIQRSSKAYQITKTISNENIRTALFLLLRSSVGDACTDTEQEDDKIITNAVLDCPEDKSFANTENTFSQTIETHLLNDLYIHHICIMTILMPYQNLKESVLGSPALSMIYFTICICFVN